MLTTGSAITWELWRLNLRHLLTALLFALSLSCILLIVENMFEVERVGLNGPSLSEITYVFILLMAVAACFNVKTNSDRISFPLMLGFVRPVPSWLLAIAPLIFAGISRAAIYLVPALVANFFFEQEFPLLPLTVRIATLAVVVAAFFWWTEDKWLRFGGQSGVVVVYVWMQYSAYLSQANDRVVSLAELLMRPQYSAMDYWGLLVWVFVALAITIFGVNRQRHGDDSTIGSSIVSKLKNKSWSSYFYWARCPVTSPLRAEIWRELRCNGAPVVAMALFFALVIPIVSLLLELFLPDTFKVSGPISPEAQLISLVAISGILLQLSIGTSSLFGIRRKHGGAKMSLFDATRALSTPLLIATKMALMILCMIASWVVVISSLWVTSSVFDNLYSLSQFVQIILSAATSDTWYALIAQITITSIQLGTFIAFFAASQVFLVLNGRNLIVVFLGGGALMAYTIAMLNVGNRIGFSVFLVHLWLIAGILTAGIVYVLRAIIRDQIMSVINTTILVGLWVLYFGVHFWLLNHQGVLGGDITTVVYAWRLILSLLPLLAVVSALRVFYLFRHQ